MQRGGAGVGQDVLSRLVEELERQRHMARVDIEHLRDVRHVGHAVGPAGGQDGGDGAFEAGEQLTTGNFAGGGANIPDGGVNNAQFCFTVPANATFQGGQAMVRFRLSKNGGLAPGNPVNSVPVLGEVEDYKVTLAKIGNLVWWDYDNDGIQELDEPGINGTNIQLTFFGSNGVAGAGSDNDQ